MKKARKRILLDPVELGRRRWKGVSKEERSAIARKAVMARWVKVREAEGSTKDGAGKGRKAD